ncbi:MAG: hypothetical protein AAGK09_08745, partial [Planctomycetota bacterium]
LLRRAKEQGLTVKTGIMVGIGERDEEVHELIHDVMEGTHVPGVADDRPATNRDPMDVPDPDRPGLTPLAPTPATPAAHGIDLDATLGEVAYPQATYPGVHDRCDILTIGQYLQPTARHLPISRWVTPAEFVGFKRVAEEAGFRHCESGPLVRSSYHADEQVLQLDRSAAGAS